MGYIPPDDEPTQPVETPAYRYEAVYVPPKCECGSDKTHGPKNTHHMPYCPKYTDPMRKS